MKYEQVNSLMSVRGRGNKPLAVHHKEGEVFIDFIPNGEKIIINKQFAK